MKTSVLCGLSLLGLLALLAGTTAPVKAQTPLVDFTGGFLSVTGSSNNFGYDFTVTGTVTVNRLGFFDWGSDGLVGSHPVGLWNVSGPTLLASAVIDNTATPVVSTATQGQWLTKPVTSVTLTPGTYMLGAYFPPNTGDFFASYAVASGIPGVTYGSPHYTNAAALSFPATISTGDTNGYFGPGAFFERTSHVPEPGALALLTGMVTAGGCLFRRRRSSAK